MNATHASILHVEPIDFLANTATLDIFQHLAPMPWSMLLDSADSPHKNSRYDVMVAKPVVTIETKHTHSTVTHWQNGKTEHSEQDPIELLQALHDSLFANIDDSLCSNTLPFGVGALGLFGYDLGQRFEPKITEPKQEYATPDMAIGLYSWSITKDNKSGEVYLCWLSDYPKPDIKALLQPSNPLAEPFHMRTAWQANMTPAQYKNSIAQVHDYLHAGDCYQINFAQRFEAKYQGDEWQAYRKLRDRNQAPFSSFIRLPQSSILSISPERFISVQDKLAQTKPIKGTRPRHTDPKRDQQMVAELLASEKDRAENLMIVDLLRNDLSKHCAANSVNVPQLFEIESFKAVHHLVSTVTGELNEQSSVFSLLRGAFPGGSITGAPKIRAMQIIDELEPNGRNIYCGSIGYINYKQDMDTNICIRTLLCEQERMYCWAGGGIVMDSNADDEYQESFDKVSKILPELE